MLRYWIANPLHRLGHSLLVPLNRSILNRRVFKRQTQLANAGVVLPPFRAVKGFRHYSTTSLVRGVERNNSELLPECGCEIWRDRTSRSIPLPIEEGSIAMEIYIAESVAFQHMKRSTELSRKQQLPSSGTGQWTGLTIASCEPINLQPRRWELFFDSSICSW